MTQRRNSLETQPTGVIMTGALKQSSFNITQDIGGFGMYRLYLHKNMSNLVFMSVCFKGDQRQLKSLYGKMKRLQERKEPLVKNDYYHSKQWLGNLVKRLGANYNSVYCRGTWDCLKMNEKTLYFTTETASQPPFRLLKLIASVYPSLSFYFEAEGDDWDCLLTNDVEGIFFPYHYLVDSDMGYEYFIELEEVCQFLSPRITIVGQSEDNLYEAIDEWEENNNDLNKYIIIKKVEVINNDELWE